MPQLYGYQEDKIIERINYLQKLGYSIEDIIKMTTQYPQLYSFKENRIADTIKLLLSFSLPHPVVLKMLKISPQLIGYSSEKIQKNLQILNSMNYSKEKIMCIITLYPSILGISSDSLLKHLEFYQELNLEEIIFKNPRNLLQSIELTYARLCYFEEHDIPISSRKLFMKKSEFERIYQITTEDLLALYPYMSSNKKSK